MTAEGITTVVLMVLATTVIGYLLVALVFPERF